MPLFDIHLCSRRHHCSCQRGCPLRAPSTGHECVIYDAIVHPDVIADAVADTTGTFRHFLCTLVINYVEQKVSSVLVGVSVTF